MKKFKIEGFEIQGEFIECEVHELPESDLAIPVSINIWSFRRFLLINGKLEWVMDYSECGEHVQKTGTMSYSEYFHQDGKIIHADLMEYMVNSPIFYRGNIHTNAEESIANAFESKRLQRVLHPKMRN